MTKTVYILLFLIPYMLSAQKSDNTFIVMDSLTRKPIPSAKLFSDNGVFYSDSVGCFKNLELKKGMIWFNKIGYVKRWVDYKGDTDTVYLMRDKYFLEEYEVTDQLPKNKTYEIGYHKEKHFFRNTFTMYQKSIIAVYVPFRNSNSEIDKIFLEYRKLKENQQAIVYLFDVDREGKPGNVIFSKTIMKGDLKKKGVIDIEDGSISIPQEGVFIGIENLKSIPYDVYKNNPSDYGIKIHCTEKIKSQLTYLMYKDLDEESRNNKWAKYIVGDENFTPCFGLEMRIL